jgi:hypothetical protein
VIIFGSVRFLLKKKVTKPNFFLKKTKPNRNRFKPTGFGSVWFGFLGKNQFKPVWLSFFGLARFFPVWLGWLGLARFFPVSVQFG